MELVARCYSSISLTYTWTGLCKKELRWTVVGRRPRLQNVDDNGRHWAAELPHDSDYRTRRNSKAFTDYILISHIHINKTEYQQTKVI